MSCLPSGVALLPLLLVTPASVAADLEEIDRAIHKEPAYRMKAPKYCLLTFGSERKDRVWISGWYSTATPRTSIAMATVT
jgi:hypothetical protein